MVGKFLDSKHRKYICRGVVLVTKMSNNAGTSRTSEEARKNLSVTASKKSGPFLEARARGAFRRRLLAWYDAHRRDLPWRKDRDPYRVWLSEIMLQQTRVAAVIEKYAQFLDSFPTIEYLAAATQASVLAAWSGLGYYRRARAMHDAACVVVRERGGRLPVTAEEWRELPGIGRYTSA